MSTDGGAPILAPVARRAPGRVVHLPPARARAPRYVLDCPPCCLIAGPYGFAEAELLAGRHDDLHHGGEPTAFVLPDDQPPPATELRGAA